MLKKIKETSEFISKKLKCKPQIGIILGTGLGGLVTDIKIEESIEYSKIPNFPVSTVEGHSGKLIFGKIKDKYVIAMQGRFHFYEGYCMQKITFPIRVMKYLGIEKLFLSNASGGVNPSFKIGDLMIIEDHINLIPNPLIGKNISSLGPRFPDMSNPYDKDMINQAKKIAEDNHIDIKKGTYAVVTGPSLETPAEYKYISLIGGDTVGMSTVPEVIVARHMSIPCFAISVITDLGVPGKIKPVSHKEIQEVAAIAEPKLSIIFKKLISNL